MIHVKQSIRWNIRPEQWSSQAQKALKKSWKECSKLAIETAKEKAPTKSVAKTIEARQVSITGFKLFCNHPAGIFLESGTRDHWIEPVKKQALHWKTAKGKSAFSKGHMVSGIKERPFIAPAIHQNANKFLEIHTNNLNIAFSK